MSALLLPPPSRPAGAFENVVQALYKYAMPKPKSECSKGEQLGVSFAAGYIAGILCAVVSHPADNLVSKLNAQKGATAGQIIKEMGWYALFTRGLGLRIVMVGTLTGLQWGIYDRCVRVAGRARVCCFGGGPWVAGDRSLGPRRACVARRRCVCVWGGLRGVGMQVVTRV